jgi:hypothetical protein
MLNGTLPILAVSSAPASEWHKQKDQKGDGSDVGFHLPDSHSSTICTISSSD